MGNLKREIEVVIPLERFERMFGKLPEQRKYDLDLVLAEAVKALREALKREQTDGLDNA